MVLTAHVQLVAKDAGLSAIRRMISLCAEARREITRLASEAKVYHWLDLNKVAYHEIKQRFGLPANLVQSLIKQVATELTRFKGKKLVSFRDSASIPIISRYIKPCKDGLKLKVINGWLACRFLCGDRQRELLNGQWRDGKLTIRDDKVYLYVSCELDAPETAPSRDVIGVDFGIVNISTDSTGEAHSGDDIQQRRRIFTHRRRNLQRNGSRAAKRKLRSIRRQQSRYQTHTNHIISKRIVAKAIDTGSAIAVEKLTGIRDRVKVRRHQMAALHNWGFGQLRSFIEYKASRAGIAVIVVDPRNTSRSCPECGHVSKRNRPSQSVFKCQSCGFSGAADFIAARNVRARAIADKPMVAAPC